MSDITLIIHGWSDSSSSFEKIKKLLIKKGIGDIDTILFMDYESREDSITFNDIIDGLNDQFISHGIIDIQGNKLKNVNVIVHSTGGLVIRHWIWRYYYRDKNRIDKCPVKRIIMLAPANFGSPLAHRGKSFFSSIIKGRWKFGDFLEVGRNILDGLELASPYQWQLAHRDLFCKDFYYCFKKIQLTILVGIEGYHTGLRKYINKAGTDGTVVIAGTSVNSAKLMLDFSKSDPFASKKAYEWLVKESFKEIGFCVLENLNHGSIVKEAGREKSQTSELLVKALTINRKREFNHFIKKLEMLTKRSYERTKKPIYQQVFLHAIDDQDISIKDYTIEFFLCKSKKTKNHAITKKRLSLKEMEFSKRLHELLTKEFHTHSKDPSYRRFLINLSDIKSLLLEAKLSLQSDVMLCISIFVPDVEKGIRYDTEHLQNIVFFKTGSKDKSLPSFFYENTTTFLELRVNRRNTYVNLRTSAKKH